MMGCSRVEYVPKVCGCCSVTFLDRIIIFGLVCGELRIKEINAIKQHAQKILDCIFKYY